VAEIKRRRRTNLYSSISQFKRLHYEDDYDLHPNAHSICLSPSSSSPKSYSLQSSPSHKGYTQIWKPSFTFHFTVISVIRRVYRRIYSFLFKPQGQRLPYFNPTVSPSAYTSSQGSIASNKLLTFLSRDDTNIFGHDQPSSTHFVPGFVSYYWNRIWSKSKRGME